MAKRYQKNVECGERDDPITHFIAECKKLGQKEKKQRHDNTARIVYFELCQKIELRQTKNSELRQEVKNIWNLS